MYLRNRNSEDYQAHRIFSNQLQNRIADDRKAYEANIASSDNVKRFHKHIRNTLCSRVKIPKLKKSDESICSSDFEVAELLSENLLNSYTSEPPFNFSTVFDHPPHSLSTVDFTPELIERTIQGLKPSSSPGIDGISARTLKKCCSSLSLPLSIIMQTSFSSHTLPHDWLTAINTPIFKKGNKLDPNNYRHISLLPIVSKIMERIVRTTIQSYLMEHNIIPQNQHGFTPGKSTITNLLLCVNDWTRSLERREPVDVIYLDFSRAFDRVPIKRLLYKLERIGIEGRLLLWLSSFLSARKFKVRVGDTLSASHDVASGVPQGSVLGPTLFLIYIRDLPDVVSSCICSIFADDTKLYGNPLHHYDDIQSDLNAVSSWSSKWLLPLNSSKSTVLHLGKFNPHRPYTIGSNPLTVVSFQVDLGITITENLSWSAHITNICGRANKFLFLIRKAFLRMSPDTAKKLYTTYVRPILEYGGPVWSCDLVRDANSLEKIQRKASRLPYGRRRPSYPDRLLLMDLQPFLSRRERGDAIITFRALKGLFPLNLEFLFTKNTNVHLRGHDLKLSRERCSTVARANFLSNRIVGTWNSLPPEVINSASVNVFKNKFDDHA